MTVAGGPAGEPIGAAPARGRILTPQQAVERALAAARADDTIVIAEEESAANLRWAGNTLTTNGVSRTRRLTVIAIRRDGDDAKAGAVCRAGVTADQVPEVVAEAEKAAAAAAPAADAAPLIGPAESASGTGGASPAAWDDPPGETGISVFGSFAPALGEVLRAAGPAGRRLYGFAEHTLTSVFLGTSAGLRLRHDQPAGRLELNAKSADGPGSAWAGAGTRDFTDVDVPGMDAALASRLGWQRRRIELPAGRYQVLLPPSAVADMLVYMYWSAGARDAMDGRTVFSKPGGGTRVGERLAGLPLTLRSDPAAAGWPSLACEPFVIARASSRERSVFDNGLALAATEWISAGTLAALTQTRHSARLSGLPLTPPIGNLILDSGGGTRSLEELVSGTKRGLLLTCLWYIREVDPQALLLTGLTRDGVYLVENGEVSGAVNNFRFNESPVAMLDRAAEAGATELTLPREWNDWFTRTAMPPLRVEGFNMSSVSQAS
jgi:predicted Zn-dependent protease